MPRFMSAPEDHAARFNDWKGYINDMSGFQMHDAYTRLIPDEELESKSKYTRFMAFTREWIDAVLGGNYGAVPEHLRKSEYEYLDVTGNLLGGDWIKDIMKVKNGEEIGDSFKFSKLRNLGDEEYVYDVFMPAYRALKESFDKRSIFQWFTNHAQYTAERDAIKALEGTMMALTRASKAGIKEAYNEYCRQLPNYDAETLREKTLEFEAQPKTVIPVRDRLQFKFRDVTSKMDFERILKNNLLDWVKGVSDTPNRLTNKIIEDLGRSIPFKCWDIDKASALGPKREEEAVKDTLNSIFVETCVELRNHVGAKEAFIKAQKITDIILKSYMPSFFKDGKYAALANNYILGNKDVLANLKRTTFYNAFYDIKDKEAFVNEVYKEANNIKDPEPAPEVKTETAPDAKENVTEVVDGKERLNLADDVNGKTEIEKSPEIKEITAPVAEATKVN